MIINSSVPVQIYRNIPFKDRVEEKKYFLISQVGKRHKGTKRTETFLKETRVMLLKKKC